MCCIDKAPYRPRRLTPVLAGVYTGLLALASLGLAGCAERVPLSTPAPARPAASRPAATVPAPHAAANPALNPAATGKPAARAEPQGPAKSWAEYQVRAAKRLVEGNPGTTYLGEVPEPLLAIPVLEIELKADGSVAQIKVLRVPSQAKDTTQLAIDAVKRAAPFGPVAHLPKPWRYVEVFLFDDDRKFKPRTLDQ